MTFIIEGRTISKDHPPFIVAEIGANHNGSLEQCLELINIAADCGADAVKFQTYTADTMTINCHGPGFDIDSGPWQGVSLYELYRAAHTPWEWHPQMFHVARNRGLLPFSAPFDPTAIDFLESIGCPMYKIASFEIVDIPLIEMAAATGCPIIMSTGMASDQEILDAIIAADEQEALAVLHCVSGYPTPPEEANIRRVQEFQWYRQELGCEVGLSDHSLSVGIPSAAVTLGATIIEKHLCLRRDHSTPDSHFSLEPAEFAQMVIAAMDTWAACRPCLTSVSEEHSRPHRRSLYVVQDIGAGECITRENVRSIRPGYGAPPQLLEQLLGERVRKKLVRGTPLNMLTIVQEIYPL